MVTAWQQERRRKQAQGLKSEAVAGLEALLSGVGGIADEQEHQKRAALLKQQSEAKAASDAAELERRKARDAADLAMEREKMGAEQARADRLERAAVLRAKGEESQRASVLRQKQTEDALTNLKRRAAGGASEEDLRRVAMADDALGELDDDAVRAVMLEAQGEERERAAKEAKAGAEVDAARALATQRLRPKTGPGRGAPRAASATGAPDGSAGAPPKPKKILPPSDIADLSNERNNIDAIGRIREMASDPEIVTGAIAGRVQSGAASVADTAKWSKFTTAVQIANKLLARAVEGGRMTDADASFYQKILASPNLGKEQFNAVLDLMDEMARETLVGKAQALSEAGYDVPASILAVQKSVQSTSPAVVPDDTPAMPPMVRVTLNGEVFEIDRADLPAALADGAKVVR
jgi:hypothetical protein